MCQHWYVQACLVPNSCPPAKEEDCEHMRISFPRVPFPLSLSSSHSPWCLWLLHSICLLPPFFLPCSMEIGHSWPRIGGRNCHLLKETRHCAKHFISLVWSSQNPMRKKKRHREVQKFSKVTQLVRGRAQRKIQACLSLESSSNWRFQTLF